MSADGDRTASVWQRIAATGPWTAQQIRAHLERSRIPIRLALAAGGSPWAVSLWFAVDDGGLWIATRGDSFVARTLAAERACGFEVASDTPPYHGVRGTGEARPEPDQAVAALERLMLRYSIREDSRLGRFLRGRAQQETAFRIVPRRLASWDFRERMADALEPGRAQR
jgi:nitroimidazol reductase NimA-like FMN-containing flavoprotein (pyridoxamine 5'-phosphate oxidase superfamily)